MTPSLKGKHIALLVTDGFEQVELTGPKEALEKLGATVDILSDTIDTVRGWHHDKPADAFKVSKTFEVARINDYDAVILPGGVMNADQIRSIPRAQELVKQAAAQEKPIAVICHGAWLLVSAGLVKGRTLTSWNSLKDDISNAGGHWIDKAVVKDGNLISSRKPDDLPAFNRQLIELLAA
ncbi:type 1 glutamine amidotransferase domain-containing protein [Pseudomonas leptonychotis]|uniref:Type 1 glutamine amidotransferase n=1 Tax=Pseudomonas leptonychotis TaxID=2448482 RepID=A0A4T1ZZT6_9PSED|nr:type 1 glutamine amidotransferase domain-containing protein [Pseudomonas leptonychotis]TIH10175.1 type 1 glutamine amidotransferase [Pseudomonas leptonychotis]